MKVFVSFAVVLMFATLCLAAEAVAKDVWIDPAEAAKVVDYQTQGEYVGDLSRAGKTQKVGVQIIALGASKFRAVAFTGGLPGDGWKRGDQQEQADGELSEQGPLVFKFANTTMTLQDAKLTATEEGKQIGTLAKVARQSPTLGMKPPEGAVVLFDGTEKAATQNWKRGQLVMKDLLRHDVESKETFGDHQLHLEFRLPFKPTARGQQRGNSGMYLHGRYECQILDSFGLDAKNSDCGGIYSIAVPQVNMCLPPLTWQTYDVDFTAARYDDAGKKTKNARVTIKHNGVVIHDDLELPHGTPGKHPEGPAPGILYLQGHGNPVVFRNIWAVKK